MNSSSPFILIGMHRSGTSLIAEILQEACIFMGADCGKTHTKSRLFMRANRLVYTRAHAEWDNPLPVNYLLSEEQVLDDMTEKLRHLVNSPQISTYIGFSRYRKLRSLANLDCAWGWKDPRSTFTLPIWLRIFPQARVLNIYRNGIDVASSLWSREKERSRELDNPLFSCRCMNLERAFELWVEYVQKSFDATAGLPEENVYHLCYEAFLQDPLSEFQKLAPFLGLDVARVDSEALTARVRGNRAYAFQSKPQLLDFYQRVCGHPLMQKLGYGNLVS